MREALALFAPPTTAARELVEHPGLCAMIEKMAVLSSLTISEQAPDNAVALLVGNDNFYLEIHQEIDVDAEREKIAGELEYYRGFVASVMKKLSNERFVSSAPAQVVDAERRKLADGEAKIKTLEESLAKLA